MKRHGVPTIFAIFGVTGNLAQKKIFPALFDLFTKDLLPEKFSIVGIARRDLSQSDFREFVQEALRKKKKYDSSLLAKFLEHVEYSQGEFDVLTTYTDAKKVLDGIDARWGQCSNKLFYLSVPPSLYELILMQLSESELSIPCDDKTGWTRILIEKPFGKDTQTAQKLDALLGKLFEEEQIYRIDHYLEKQTLQNILAFRFSNTIFETLWNKKHIQKVEINLLEDNTAEDRGAFYDANGALRDVGQNHMLQMLALVAMEQPASLDCSLLRKAREDVFKKLQKPHENEVVRGQYDGYIDTAGVEDQSETETFFSLVTRIHNKRWKGVPFYLTSGKALHQAKVEIVVHFKDETPDFFMPRQHRYQECNRITISIQPEEKIAVLFWVKVPGFEDKIEPKELSFSFHDEEGEHIDAYEKVLFDCISGDQTSFISTKEVLYTWEYIMSVKDAIKNTSLYTYPVGSKSEDIKKDTAEDLKN